MVKSQFCKATRVLNSAKGEEVNCIRNETVDTNIDAQCNNTCVPEPHTMLDDIDHIGEAANKPVAIEWYSVIHYWDLIWMGIAVYVQLRMRNLRDVSTRKIQYRC